MTSRDDVETGTDAADQLKSKGIYYITGTINEDSLLDVHQDIILKHLDPAWVDDIQIIINTCGGLVAEGWALIDLLDWVRMDVKTVGLGECASTGACLLAAGTKGKRVISSNTSIMIHAATHYIGGDKPSLISQMKYVEEEYERDVNFWIKHSNLKNIKEVEKHLLTSKDVYLTGEQALAFGIVDSVIVK